jgi:hypothetical protein
MNFTDGQFELAGGIVSTVDDCHTARAIVEEAVAGDTCQGDWDGCRVDGYECSADGAVGHLFSGCRRGDRHISWVTPVE